MREPKMKYPEGLRKFDPTESPEFKFPDGQVEVNPFKDPKKEAMGGDKDAENTENVEEAEGAEEVSTSENEAHVKIKNTEAQEHVPENITTEGVSDAVNGEKSPEISMSSTDVTDPDALQNAFEEKNNIRSRESLNVSVPDVREEDARERTEQLGNVHERHRENQITKIQSDLEKAVQDGRMEDVAKLQKELELIEISRELDDAREAYVMNDVTLKSKVKSLGGLVSGIESLGSANAEHAQLKSQYNDAKTAYNVAIIEKEFGSNVRQEDVEIMLRYGEISENAARAQIVDREKIKHLPHKFESTAKKIIEKYRKIPTKYKIMATVGLGLAGSGAVVVGGATAGVAGIIGLAMRGLSAAAMYTGSYQFVERLQNKRSRKKNEARDEEQIVAVNATVDGKKEFVRSGGDTRGYYKPREQAEDGEKRAIALIEQIKSNQGQLFEQISEEKKAVIVNRVGAFVATAGLQLGTGWIADKLFYGEDIGIKDETEISKVSETVTEISPEIVAEVPSEEILSTPPVETWLGADLSPEALESIKGIADKNVPVEPFMEMPPVSQAFADDVTYNGNLSQEVENSIIEDTTERITEETFVVQKGQSMTSILRDQILARAEASGAPIDPDKAAYQAYDLVKEYAAESDVSVEEYNLIQPGDKLQVWSDADGKMHIVDFARDSGIISTTAETVDTSKIIERGDGGVNPFVENASSEVQEHVVRIETNSEVLQDVMKDPSAYEKLLQETHMTIVNLQDTVDVFGRDKVIFEGTVWGERLQDIFGQTSDGAADAIMNNPEDALNYNPEALRSVSAQEVLSQRSGAWYTQDGATRFESFTTHARDVLGKSIADIRGKESVGEYMARVGLVAIRQNAHTFDALFRNIKL